MGKVEKNDNPVTIEPSYPAGYIIQGREDEIDLVDLWIVMWSYRKLSLSSAILFIMIGILCFEIFYNSTPTSSVRSIIEMETIIDDGKRIPIVDPDILSKRIEYNKLIRFSSRSEFEKIKPLILATSATPIGQGSPLVEIVSKVPPTGDITLLSRFHDQLLDEILLELKSSAESLRTGDANTILLSLKSSIANLNGLMLILEQDLAGGGGSQVTSNQSMRDQIALRKANIESEINILTERMEYLNFPLSNMESQVLLKANVSEESKGLNKTFAYLMIVMLSLILALFLVMSVIFTRKIKERIAAGG